MKSYMVIRDGEGNIIGLDNPRNPDAEEILLQDDPEVMDYFDSLVQDDNVKKKVDKRVRKNARMAAIQELKDEGKIPIDYEEDLNDE
jgi:hypothetical protein